MCVPCSYVNKLSYGPYALKIILWIGWNKVYGVASVIVMFFVLKIATCHDLSNPVKETFVATHCWSSYNTDLKKKH